VFTSTTDVLMASALKDHEKSPFIAVLAVSERVRRVR
jgi:hypothetical protein